MLYTLLTTLAALSALFTSPLFSHLADLERPLFVLGEEYSEFQGPTRINNDSLGVVVTATSALVADKKSGHILYNKNSDQKLPSASITKLMTALVILDLKPDWDKTLTIIREDHREGNIVYLYTGEEISVKTLFDLMLVASSNEAAVALARGSGKEQDDFVELMNKKAKELGLLDTVFYDPTGLDGRNISTARDITLLAHEAFSQAEIVAVSDIEKYKFTVVNTKKSRIAFNTNKLLDSFLNDRQLGYHLTGGKTGFLGEVGYNMTVEVANNGYPIIVTVFGSIGEEERLRDIKSLADWVYRNYEWP